MIFNFSKILEDVAPSLPQANDTDLAAIFAYVYSILGVIAVIVGIYGGIKLIISQGNAEKVATARRTVIYAIVGLIVIILAAAITTFVAQRLV